MFAVVVDFELHPKHAEPFRREMVANASASLTGEPGCRQFDVCCAPDNATLVFLYELYDDRAAFDAHLNTPHFLAFNTKTSGWIKSKSVRTFERAFP